MPLVGAEPCCWRKKAWKKKINLVVLGSEVGGRWNEQARTFVRDLVRLKANRAPPALRAAAFAAWARRWWGMLSVAVQQAVASTALGGWVQPLSLKPVTARRWTPCSTTSHPPAKVASR